MLVLSTKDIVEMIFCVCLYQVSVFYMLQTKRMQGLTKLEKKHEFLVALICLGFVFFFARTWIIEEVILQYIMYLLLFISILILPLYSIKNAK